MTIPGFYRRCGRTSWRPIAAGGAASHLLHSGTVWATLRPKEFHRSQPLGIITAVVVFDAPYPVHLNASAPPATGAALLQLNHTLVTTPLKVCNRTYTFAHTAMSFGGARVGLHTVRGLNTKVRHCFVFIYGAQAFRPIKGHRNMLYI